MQRQYVVGSVPYVNGRPLVSAFEDAPELYPVRIRYEVPSLLPALLDSGEADAVLASSIEALRTPNRRIAGGLCIASEGPVLSVRLFSKVPISEIRTLALDQSSLTSNALAQIVLRESHGIQPQASPAMPDLDGMLRERDACILIGDKGMRAEGNGLHVLDLGEAWLELTGLPFVWALWIGSETLSPELAGYLQAARRHSCLGAGAHFAGTDELERQESQIRAISQDTAWTFEEVRRYLMETIIFDLGARELEGLRKFSQKLQEHGFDAPHFPEIVEPDLGVIHSQAASRSRAVR